MYEEIRSLLAQTTEQFLASKNPSEQFFATGFIRNWNGSIPREMLAKLSAILAENPSKRLKNEVMGTVIDHFVHYHTETDLQFLFAHAGLLNEVHKKHFQWGQGHLLKLIMENPLDSDIARVACQFLGWNEQQACYAQEIFTTVFVRQANDDLRFVSIQPDTVESFRFVVNHSEEFISSVQGVRAWFPQFTSSIYDLQALRDAGVANATCLFIERFYDPTYQQAVIAYIEKQGELPLQSSAELVRYLKLDTQTESDVDHIALTCLQSQRDPHLSE